MRLGFIGPSHQEYIIKNQRWDLFPKGTRDVRGIGGAPFSQMGPLYHDKGIHPTERGYLVLRNLMQKYATGAFVVYDPRMDKYPLFISYSRTGCHWINCVMELYFDRPRLRKRRVTFLDRSRKDYLWFHDHDYECDDPRKAIPPRADVLYLYRDPVPTVYSNLMYRRFEDRRSKNAYNDIVFDKASVEQEAKRYRNNLYKWLVQFPARTVVKHERFKSNRVEEFKKIIRHFNQPVDIDKINFAFDRVTKTAISEAEQVHTPAMNQQLLTDAYKSNREKFAEHWRNYIQDLVVTEALSSFFGD